MTMPVSVRGVSWDVSGIKILRGVDFDLLPGEVLGVVGPNGSGKSTLLRCLYGEITATSGEIGIFGRPLRSFRPTELARIIAVVLQHVSVDAEARVRQVLELGRLPHRRLLQSTSIEERRIIESAATRTGIAGLLDRVHNQLSGGEQQRVALARALVQQPRILMLDEPTNHLDLQYQVALVSLVKELALPTIVVLHDLTLAARMCDRLLVLSEGEVAATGAPGAVLTPHLVRSVWQVSAQLISDSDGLPVVLPRLSGARTP